MKIRIKFQKYGVMKFIGHLDIMRYFQKAIRRAGIDICYSEGYSPHQIMSFAAPLGVGITSEGEYLDIEVHTSLPSAEAVAALNDVMVDGVCIVSYRRLPDSAKTAMSLVAAADYELFFKDGYEIPATLGAFGEALQNYFEGQDEVLITKKTKKGERVMDLKQLVYDFQVREREGKPCFYLMVSTGSADNLKPELVLETLFGAMGIAYDERAIQIHRKDVYAADGEGFLSLGEMGEIIET